MSLDEIFDSDLVYGSVVANVNFEALQDGAYFLEHHVEPRLDGSAASHCSICIKFVDAMKLRVSRARWRRYFRTMVPQPSADSNPSVEVASPLDVANLAGMLPRCRRSVSSTSFAEIRYTKEKETHGRRRRLSAISMSSLNVSKTAPGTEVEHPNTEITAPWKDFPPLLPLLWPRRVIQTSSRNLGDYSHVTEQLPSRIQELKFPLRGSSRAPPRSSFSGFDYMTPTAADERSTNCKNIARRFSGIGIVPRHEALPTNISLSNSSRTFNAATYGLDFSNNNVSNFAEHPSACSVIKRGYSFAGYMRGIPLSPLGGTDGTGFSTLRTDALDQMLSGTDPTKRLRLLLTLTDRVKTLCLDTKEAPQNIYAGSWMCPKSKHLAPGEDALFHISPRAGSFACGVADGVGEWGAYGIGSRAFAHGLMSSAARTFAQALLEEQKNLEPPPARRSLFYTTKKYDKGNSAQTVIEILGKLHGIGRVSSNNSGDSDAGLRGKVLVELQQENVITFDPLIRSPADRSTTNDYLYCDEIGDTVNELTGEAVSTSTGESIADSGNANQRCADQTPVVSQQMSTEPKMKDNGVRPTDAFQLLQHAYNDTQQLTDIWGSSTVLVASWVQGSPLTVVNLGDSCFMLFRCSRRTPFERRVLLRQTMEQHHFFNCPYQAAKLPDTPELIERVRDKGFSALADVMKKSLSTGGVPYDSPSLANNLSVDIEAGDLLLLCTDGVTDNLFPNEIKDILSLAVSPSDYALLKQDPMLDEIVCWSEPNFAPTTPEILARCIAETAFNRSLDPKASTPFSKKANRAGVGFMSLGGKQDDISVVCAWVV